MADTASKINPFSITFGKEPKNEIERENVVEEIVSDFTSEPSSQQIVLLTGVRGTGKSALTAKLMKTFSNMKDWYVIDLLMGDDMLASLGGKICSLKGCRKLFQEEKISLTAFGIGITVSKANMETNTEVSLDKMFKTLTKKKKKVLITIDDVASTKEMRVFAHFFQSCLMKDYNIFLIMNGIYDNIENLQNEKTLTFLQRAPKIALTPLNKMAVANMYAKVFNFPENTIKKMASATGGYPYAVQAMGYTVWKHHADDKDIDIDEVLPKLDLILADGVYDKLWTDMSETDRRIAEMIAKGDADKVNVADIISETGISKSLASNYKKRLVKKGIIEDVRGKFIFALPGFDRYVREQFEL